jgi:tetratricopeptide (TPR) repeat protein
MSDADKATTAPPRLKVETALKWIGGITAVLSLGFAINQATLLIADVRERERQIAELQRIGQTQRDAADFEGAWATFDKALKAAEAGGRLAKLSGRLSDEQDALRRAQENIAMEWLENARAFKGQPFSDLVDKLAPVLNRGAANASGTRKADLLAHLGWALFLRSRDGRAEADPASMYRQALQIDPDNPYAHAHWGHWLLWRRDRLADAKTHFAAALASPRARGRQRSVRPYVRSIQLAALKNLGSDGDAELLAAVDEMRRHDEEIEAPTRNDVYSIYAGACASRTDPARLQRLAAVVPAAAQLATFRALFYGAREPGFDAWKRPGRDACLATLQELAGHPDEARQTWRALLEAAPASGGMRERARAALARPSAQR